jgi:hypothetical protein
MSRDDRVDHLIALHEFVSAVGHVVSAELHAQKNHAEGNSEFP